MNQTVLTTLALIGFSIAFFHAAIPTHWLPFVLASRVQRWNRPKTVAITALAGTGHVAVTALLGLGMTWFGTAVSSSLGTWFPRLAAGVLLAFGIYYVYRQLAGKGHVHGHYPHEHLYEGNDEHKHEHTHDHEHEHAHAHAHEHGHEHAHHGHQHHHHNPSDHSHSEEECAPRRTSDRAAILSLLAFLTFSPCEGFLPIYASGIEYGWTGFAVLTVILSLGTVLGMVIFTSLTLAGLSRLKLGFLEKYESLIMGTLLCAVGLLIFVVEH